jgi:hypothetical protein
LQAPVRQSNISLPLRFLSRLWLLQTGILKTLVPPLEAIGVAGRISGWVDIEFAFIYSF